MVLGDSLSAEHGIQAGQGWVALLQKRLDEQAYAYRVVNASVSGITTDGVLSRLEANVERYGPSIVVLEVGGNDGLIGLPPKHIRANLTAIIQTLKRQNISVLLIKMLMLPNFGPRYTQQFLAVFEELPDQHGIHAAPFILDGIAKHPELMQSDRIHPRAAAQIKMLDNIWPSLLPLL